MQFDEIITVRPAMEGEAPAKPVRSRKLGGRLTRNLGPRNTSPPRQRGRMPCSSRPESSGAPPVASLRRGLCRPALRVVA
jgi:hypothetical protein